MKGMFVDENMSNLTSASNEASLSSSSNRNEIGTMYPPPQIQQSFASVPINTNNQTQANKKKRNLPGNPDPDAEVVALSPKSLMATNRFLCEVCNKGFQRDQNLQLHRRGHNLPWKLKQRSKTEVVRKKVFICPEPSCVHHEPSRALGDLTGIKKHYSRKHGEKKWKCEKCSKRYAVQSDWKAHSKICGTREYRCDCGTLFSRRDSFITHRAFCDALAEETARSSSSSLIPPNHHLPLHMPFNFPLKSEPQHFLQLPSWLDQQEQQTQNPNPNNNNSNNFNLPSPSLCPSPHMSATALLQKAAQMGVTMSQQSGPHHPIHHHHMPSQHQHHHHHSSALGNLSSSDNHQGGFANASTAGCIDQLFNASNSLASTSVGSTPFEEAYNGMISASKRSDHSGFQEALFSQASVSDEAMLNTSKEGAGAGNDELTRDFLGVRGFPTTPTDQHFLSMAGLDHINTSSPYHRHLNDQGQIPWQG